MTTLYRTSEDDQVGVYVVDAQGNRVLLPASFMVDSLGNEIGGASGSKDTANSSTAVLGAGATFTGPWVSNNDAHIAASWFASHAGTLYIDISSNDGASTAFSRTYDTRAGEGRFDAFVKGSRAHRVRFVNGATAQTTFTLLTMTGNHLFPFSVSERDEPVFVAAGRKAVAATEYVCLVDLSDRTNWKHSEVGRVDLHSNNIFFDRASTAKGSIRIGVITRINATNADITFVLGTSFDKGDVTTLTRDRVFAAPIRLGQSGGVLTRAVSSEKLLNVAAVRTGATITSAISGVSVTPALGDIIVQFEHTGGGSYDAFVSGSYSANVSAS